jgi:anti-anti-sigma factor
MAQSFIELLVVDGRPTVRGECDLSSSGDIEAWLGSFDGQTIEVDVSGVTFIDSSGLKAFINARRQNPQMRVVEANALVLRLLDITGTRNYLVGEPGNPR